MSDSQHAGLVAAVDALINDTLWTETGHFVEEQRWARCHYWLGGTAAVGAAIAARTIVAEKLPVLGVLSALVAAVNAGLVTFLRPDEQARRHLTAGRTLEGASSHVAALPRYRPCRRPCRGARVRLDELTKAKANADDQAPAVSDRAIRTVEKRFKQGDFSRSRSGHDRSNSTQPGGSLALTGGAGHRAEHRQLRQAVAPAQPGQLRSVDGVPGEPTARVQQRAPGSW